MRAACRNMRFRPLRGERLVEREVAVLVVAGDGKAQMREMHADLVRAAVFSSASQQSEARLAPAASVNTVCDPALPSSTLTRRSPDAVTYLSASAGRPVGLAPAPWNQHEIPLVHAAGAHLLVQAVSALRFLASSSTPEVSRSSRCTSSRKRSSGRSSAQLLDYAAADAAAAVRRTPAGLLSTSSLILEQDVASTARGADRPAAGSGAGRAVRTGGIRSRSPACNR